MAHIFIVIIIFLYYMILVPNFVNHVPAYQLLLYRLEYSSIGLYSRVGLYFFKQSKHRGLFEREFYSRVGFQSSVYGNWRQTSHKIFSQSKAKTPNFGVGDP